MVEASIPTPVNAPLSTIEILTGNDALDIIYDLNFQIAWDELYDLCPWATVFQNKKFTITWYSTYAEKYLPILIRAYKGEKLTGLLMLAKSTKGIIVAAGANRAEYQVWLAYASEGVNFIQKALVELKSAFPKCDLLLKFIPNNVPLDWARTDNPWKNNCIIRVFNQPLWFLNNERISNSLKKRSKIINRLKRLGGLSFEVINSYDTFKSIIDGITTQSDFRKGAIYNTTPFQDDPLRKKFLMKAFEQDLLHVSVLRLNEEIIACKIATKAVKSLIFQGLVSHTPIYAPYSPGILHFLMLGKHLAEEGYDLFDLSPGEDAYKLYFATVNQQAYELRVAGTRKSYIAAITAKSLFAVFVKNKQKIYHFLSLLGISPKTLRLSTRKIMIAHESLRQKRMSAFTLSIRDLLRIGSATQQAEIYKITWPILIELRLPIKKNSFEDLIRYDAGSKLLRGEFLTQAMEKFETGQQAYTLTEDSCLLHCVWVQEQTVRSKDTGSKNNILLPDGSIILYDVYSHQKGKSSLKDFITCVASTITAGNSKKDIYLVADASDKLLCSAFEKVTS